MVTKHNAALNAITPLGACAASLAGERGMDIDEKGVCRRPSIQSAAQSRRNSFEKSSAAPASRLTCPALPQAADNTDTVEEDADDDEAADLPLASAATEPAPASTARGDGAYRAYEGWIGNSKQGKKGFGGKGHRIYTINCEVEFSNGFSRSREGRPVRPPSRRNDEEATNAPIRFSVSTSSIAAFVGNQIKQTPVHPSAEEQEKLDRQSTLLPKPPRLIHSQTAPPHTHTLEPIPSVPSLSPRASPTPHLPKHRLDTFTPSWSLKYAELIGSTADESSNEKPRAKTAAVAPQQTQETSAATESVYLAKNGMDKRLPKLKGKNKVSRLKARRTAITSAHYQSKLQLTIAVKKAWKDHPGHMRRLNKVLEEIVGRGQVLKVENKEIENNRLQQLTEKTGMHEDEICNLFDAFHRYDIDDSGSLDRNEVRQCLFDLGLQPRSQEEKVEVNEVMCDLDLEGLRQYSFEQFLNMVKCVRERLRQTQLGECMVMFEEADADGNKVLDMTEVLRMLDVRLGLAARTDDERHELQAIFNQCDSDADGEVNFEEFQNFVQLARAKIMMIRRKEELTIAKAFQLNSDLINEFRMDLPVLWELFNRYDLEGKSRMSKNDLLCLLVDIGLAPWRPQPQDPKMTIVQDVTNMIGQHWNEFPHVLNIMKMIRSKTKSCHQKDLHERFHMQDRYSYGELEMSEIYPILEAFKMLPKSRAEQLSIKTVIERLDTDGSGTLCFSEFEDFFQRLTEHVQYIQREQERSQVMSMGFNEKQLHHLRNMFASLNPSLEGRIGQIGVVSAINRARDTIFLECHLDEGRVRDITRNAQQFPEHMIDFLDFSSTLKQVIVSRNDIAEEHVSSNHSAD